LISDVYFKKFIYSTLKKNLNLLQLVETSVKIGSNKIQNEEKCLISLFTKVSYILINISTDDRVTTRGAAIKRRCCCNSVIRIISMVFNSSWELCGCRGYASYTDKTLLVEEDKLLFRILLLRIREIAARFPCGHSCKRRAESKSGQ